MLHVFFTAAYTAGLEFTEEPRSLKPSEAAVERSATFSHDREVTKTTHAWSGYILVEMQKCAAD